MKNCTTKLHTILNQPGLLHAKIIWHATEVNTKWWTEHWNCALRRQAELGNYKPVNCQLGNCTPKWTDSQKLFYIKETIIVSVKVMNQARKLHTKRPPFKHTSLQDLQCSDRIQSLTGVENAKMLNQARKLHINDLLKTHLCRTWILLYNALTVQCWRRKNKIIIMNRTWNSTLKLMNKL